MGLIRKAVVVAAALLVVGTVVLPVVFREMSLYPEMPNETKDRVDAWLKAHPLGTHGPQKPAAKVTLDMIEQYERDGYVLVRNAIDKDTLQLLREIVDFTYENPNLPTRWTGAVSCLNNQFDPASKIPHLRKLLASLPFHWLAKDLMGADALAWINNIIHANMRNCDGMGYLSTHSDMNTSPFNMTVTRSTIGDNSMVAWIALDEMSENTVTMAIGKGSHKNYDKRMGPNAHFDGDEYCKMWFEDLEREKLGDASFTGTFETLSLNPRDALIFHGLTYHDPKYTCAGPDGCTRFNTRRITLRYLDADRTYYRNDEGKATNHATRRCGTFGTNCRYNLGDPVRSSDPQLPTVIDVNNAIDLRDIMDNDTPTKSPVSMYIGSGLIVHHQTCGIEYEIVKKLGKKVLESFSTSSA